MAKPVLNGLDLASQRIVNVGNPSSAQDAATKNYSDTNDAKAKRAARLYLRATIRGCI